MKENPTLRQQNLAALALAVISLLGCVMILFLPPRPTMADTGLYSLVLPQLGLTQGSTQGVFAGTGIPWGSLLQWTSGPSLVYPAALAQLLAFGGEVSLTLLAGILAVLYAIALFFPRLGNAGVKPVGIRRYLRELCALFCLPLCLGVAFGDGNGLCRRGLPGHGSSAAGRRGQNRVASPVDHRAAAAHGQ